MLPSGNLPHGNIADKTLLIFYLRYLGLVCGMTCGGPLVEQPPAPRFRPPPPMLAQPHTSYVN